MSKAFNFSLQKVLDVRTIVEDKKALSLKKAQSETELEKQKLAAIEAEKQAVSKTPTPAEEQEISLQSLNTRSAYLDQLTHEIEDQSQQVSVSEARVDEKREDFIQATKAKMVLEKLKENHQQAYRKKANQTEIKEDSELASRVVQREHDS